MWNLRASARSSLSHLLTVTCGLRIALTLLLLGSGCNGLLGSGNRAIGGDDAGPTCPRDREALSTLLVQPQSCETSAECPDGSYCDAEQGQCNWECYSDSDCGSNSTCSCDGRCFAGSDAGPSPDVDPACPRDLELLEGPATLDRTCVFDEDCPYGSHCDRGTGKCSWSCLSTDDMAYGCPGTEVCDCRGLCVEPGAASACDQSENLPTLSLSTNVLAFSSTDTDDKQVTLELRTKDVNYAGNPAVHLHAPSGFELSNMTDGPSAELDLASWSFSEILDENNNPTGEYAASVDVTVSAVGALDDDDAPWAVKITSSDISKGWQSILLAPPAVTGSAPTSGYYEGYLVLETAEPDAPAFRLPVRAWASDVSQHIVIYDKSRTITPGGALSLPIDGSVVEMDWIRSDTGGDPTVAKAEVLSAPTLEEPSGALSGGEVAVTVPMDPFASFRFTFELTRAGDFASTACNCGPGTYCEADIGTCVAGEDWRTSSTFGNRVTHVMSDWAAAAADWMFDGTPFFGDVSGFQWLGRLICYQEESAGALPGLSPNDSLSPWFLTPITGDLLCSNLMMPWTIPAGHQRDIQSLGSYGNPYWGEPVLDGSELLDKCLDELRETIPDPVYSEDDWFGESRPSCVSFARFYPALKWALDGVLVGTPAGPPDTRSARIGQWLLGQWLELLSFVSRQSRQERELDRVLADSAGSESTANSVPELLALLENGFDVLLSSDVVSALSKLPRDTLRYPDYRGHRRPAAYWTFDPEDSTANGTADLVGNAQVSLLTEGAGSNPSVVTDAFAQRGEDISISVWLSWTGCTEYWGHPLVSLASTTNGNHRPFFLSCFGPSSYHPGRIEFIWSDVDVTWENWTIYVVGTFNTDIPIHLVVTRDSGNKKLSYYVNGEYYGGVTYTEDVLPLPPNEAPVIYLGTQDEVAIYDTPLTDEEVAEIYARGPSGPGNDNPLVESLPLFSDREDDFANEHALGLPVRILEATTEYLHGYEAAAREAANVGLDQCRFGGTSSQRQAALERVGRAQRYALSLEALAGRLYERAAIARDCSFDDDCVGLAGATCESIAGENVCAVGAVPVTTAPPWDAEYGRALDELAAVRGKLEAQASILANCENGFGISDVARPLYFGDVLGTNSRAFASSDYLINTWARPAVENAANLLESARSAWLAKRNSEVQQLLTDQEKELRVEELETQGSREIIRLCGLVNTDPLDVRELFEGSDPLTPDNCFETLDDPWCNLTTPDQSHMACYRGEMGAAEISISSARVNAHKFISDYIGAQNQVAAKSDYCVRLTELNQVILGLTEEQLQDFRDTLWLNAGTSFIASVASFASGGPLSALANIIGSGLNLWSTDNKLHFQKQLAMVQGAEQIEQCIYEVQALSLSLDAKARAVAQAIVEADAAEVALENMKDHVSQLLYEGDAQLAREEQRVVPSIAHHYWLDEKVDSFKEHFAWAKRVTYLAMLAVEYEFQQSLGLRDAILTATTPAQLDDALLLLEQEQASRTINGRRPEDSSLVLSLRDDILKIAPHETTLAGERDWSPARRFRERLNSPEYAVYDNDGNYLGQGIPFALREDGALKLRCAERLWRVTATIQGDILDAQAPGTSMFLMKRNTFSSQWCDGKGDGSDYQVSSVRPSAQLFSPDADPAPESDIGAYTTAMMYPWFNVPRSQFYQEQYVEGSSEELAGRGLYGDYVLLFPESGMLEKTNCSVDGLDLDQVEDVLIRFDFVSVDDLTNL